MSTTARHRLPWAVATLVLVGAALSGCQRKPELPESFGTLPAFGFTRQDGQALSSETMKGRIWVANFIFTRCPTVCPAFTRKMAGIQERTRGLGEDLQLVSFSVDPDFDTPEVLTAYAKKHGAEPRRWSFVTGKQEAMQRTVIEGFKQLVSKTGQPDDGSGGILHGTHFVLVDAELQIRGFYASNDAQAVDRLISDAEALVRERKKGL